MFKMFSGLLLTVVASGVLSAPAAAQPSTTEAAKRRTLQGSNSNPSKEIRIHRMQVGWVVGPVQEINFPTPVGVAPSAPSLPGLGELNRPGNVRWVMLRMQLGSSKLIECKWAFGAEGTPGSQIPIGDLSRSFTADGSPSASCNQS